MINHNPKLNLTSFLFFFILIDLLFLPKITSPILIPSSLIICIFIFFYFNFTIKKAVIFLMLCLTFSLTLFYGFNTKKILHPSEYSDDVKRVFQFLSFFLYSGFAYRYILNESRIQSLVYLFRFAFIVFILIGTFFIINPSLVLSNIATIYPESTFLHEFNLKNLRFSYIFADPNGAAYFFTMCLAFYLNIERNSKFKLINILIVTILVIITQSRGGLSSLMLLLLWFLVFDRKKLPQYFLPMATVVALMLFYILLQLKGFSEILELLENRSQQEESLGGGRIDKYSYWLNNFNFLPWGDGYNLFINNQTFRPHSDLIRLNLSYGMIVMLLFFYLIKPRVKEHISILIPFLAGFFINAMIDEYRSFGLFLIFYGLLINLHNYNKKNFVKHRD